MIDWLFHNKINVEDYKNYFDTIINNIPKDNLQFKSTRGINSKQYDLIEYEKDFSNIVDVVKKKILKIIKNIKLNLLSAWTVIGDENSYHLAHRHNDIKNHISTVLYLNVPEKKTFHQSGNFFYFKRDENNNIVYNSIEPEEGSLIIMPVHIWHGTYPQAPGKRQTLNMDFEYIKNA